MKSLLPGTTSQLGLGVALAVGVILSTWIYQSTSMSMRNTITVKGYAEQSIVSEQAKWTGSISKRDSKLSEAYKRVAEDAEIFLQFAKDSGFDDKDIGIEDISHVTLYKPKKEGYGETNEIEGYVVTQNFKIKSDNLNAIKDFANSVSRLNEGGLELKSFGASYYYPSDKLEKIKLEMLAEATKNAHHRAMQFAENSGAQVGRLMSARQGLFQVLAPDSAASEYDRYDTYSIDKIIKLVVTLTYSVS